MTRLWPGQFVDHADIHTVFRLRTAKQILNEQCILFGQSGEKIRLQRGKMIRCHADIGFSPPNAVFGFIIADDELVVCGPSCVFAGFDDQWALFGQLAFSTRHRRFAQCRRTEVPMLLGRIDKALII